MHLKKKWALLAGTALILASILAGAAFAGSGPGAGKASVRLDQAVANGKITAEEAAVLEQLRELRRAAMEKLKSDSQALINQAVQDGKITQEQADRLLQHKSAHPWGKRGPFGGRGFGPRGLSPEEWKAMIDEKVKAGKLTQEQADWLLKRHAPSESR